MKLQSRVVRFSAAFLCLTKSLFGFVKSIYLSKSDTNYNAEIDANPVSVTSLPQGKSANSERLGNSRNVLWLLSGDISGACVHTHTRTHNTYTHTHTYIHIKQEGGNYKQEK